MKWDAIIPLGKRFIEIKKEVLESELLNKDYWEERYKNGYTGWDVGFITPPIQRILDQLEDLNTRILIPGAGNAYEAEYAFNKGFSNVYVCDWATSAFNRLLKVIPD
ncbi:MAG: hypothetical protein HKN16_00840, partial [Saprospiraceae bacterium]|nr:hypothetical protein [Saprospiraceae bacterium]